MSRNVQVLAVVTAALVPFTTPAAVAGGEEDKVKLRAKMDGAQEVPGPGDTDGKGHAKLDIEGDTLCFKLQWKNIGVPTSGHVHEAPTGVNGPVVVNLLGNAERITKDEAVGCVTDPDVPGIAADPSEFYVNLHNGDFPAGAIRGQLG